LAREFSSIQIFNGVTGEHEMNGKTAAPHQKMIGKAKSPDQKEALPKQDHNAWMMALAAVSDTTGLLAGALMSTNPFYRCES
jgi:hypothetical protein